MRNLTNAELTAIERRAELWFRYGDTTALRPEDVADLLAEVRELRKAHSHMVALYRQAQDQLREHVAAYSGRCTPAGDLEFP